MVDWSIQRRSQRLPLFVEVELVAVRTLERLRGFTGNISRDGCFVRSDKPFPNFTQVRVELRKARQRVEAVGSVVHFMPGEGMGISFEEVTPAYQAILDAWLAESGNAGG